MVLGVSRFKVQVLFSVTEGQFGLQAYKSKTVNKKLKTDKKKQNIKTSKPVHRVTTETKVERINETVLVCAATASSPADKKHRWCI